MVERRLGFIWAAFSAAAVGVLTVALTGGGAPSFLLVAALVAVPAAITLVVRLRPRRPPMGRVGVAPQVVTTTAPRPDHSMSEVDRHSLRALCSALDSRQLDWLRTNDFASPWLHGKVRPAIELGPAVAELAEAQFQREIHDALLRLSDATSAFVEFYDRNTSGDPLLQGDEWHFFEWADHLPDMGSVPYQEQWGGRAARLHELAARLAESYEALTAVATPLTLVANPNAQGRRMMNALAGR